MYDEPDKEFVPKRYCKCVNNNGIHKDLLYNETDGRRAPTEQYCAYCGHVSWQTYVKRQVDIKKIKSYYY